MLSENAGQLPCRERVRNCSGAICGERSDGGGARDGEFGGSRLGGSEGCGTKLRLLCAHTTEFDITFTLLRPGLLHATIYDLDNNDKNDNAYAGIYLGDVVFRR